jgi:endonuclease YncB( thermonuclease family)
MIGFARRSDLAACARRAQGAALYDKSFSDPNRLPPVLRQLSRLGRTRGERTVLLAIGALVAFLVGRWTSEDRSDGTPREIPAQINGTPLVLDGDSLDFNGLRVRIFGIDAFERDQTCRRADGSIYSCGQLAREALVIAIARNPVSCTRRDVDRYGRMVAICRTRDGDLGARLVLDGSALAYREYSTDYVDEEETAKRQRRGAWGGTFEAPWDFRHRGASQ